MPTKMPRWSRRAGPHTCRSTASRWRGGRRVRSSPSCRSRWKTVDHEVDRRHTDVATFVVNSSHRETSRLPRPRIPSTRRLPRDRPGARPEPWRHSRARCTNRRADHPASARLADRRTIAMTCWFDQHRRPSDLAVEPARTASRSWRRRLMGHVTVNAGSRSCVDVRTQRPTPARHGSSYERAQTASNQTHSSGVWSASVEGPRQLLELLAIVIVVLGLRALSLADAGRRGTVTTASGTAISGATVTISGIGAGSASHHRDHERGGTLLGKQGWRRAARGRRDRVGLHAGGVSREARRRYRDDGARAGAQVGVRRSRVAARR